MAENIDEDNGTRSSVFNRLRANDAIWGRTNVPNWNNGSVGQETVQSPEEALNAVFLATADPFFIRLWRRSQAPGQSLWPSLGTGSNGRRCDRRG